MSWVVDDSEDEDNFEASLKPQEAPMQSHSVISEFSAHEIVLPVSNQTSPISNFPTLDNGIHRPDTTTDSIVVAFTSVPAAAGAEPAPAKPKRPKPRPAYKGHLGGSDSIEQSTSAASVIASAINQIGPDSSREPIVDATFSLDIAERAKTRKRNTTGSSVKTPSSSKDAGSIIVEGSSKDMIIAISSDGEDEPSPSRVDFTTQSRRQEQARPSQASSKISHIPASNVPTLLLHSDSSSAIRITRAPSPLFDQQHQNPGSMPPSSPFQPRKPKRRLLDEDYTFFDDGISADHDTRYLPELAKKDGEPSTKKQKRTKEKKPREGKSKTVVEGDAVTATKASTKKRAEKSKSASEQPEFKSKEFVDDSDDGEEDDLLLRPSDHCKKSKTTSSSVPRTSYSDPVSMEVSVQASINESARPSGLVSAVSTPTTTKTVEHSASILPSANVSIGPSADVSEVPCTDAHVSACVSAPPPVLPPSPSMPRMSEVDRSSPVKKRKKKRKDAASAETGREALVSFNMDIDLGVPAEQSLVGQSDVPIEEPSKKKVGRPKKKKKLEVQSSTVDETRGQGASSSSASCLPPNDTESSEQSISTPASKETQQHSKKPKGKKHGTIVSSDEDEVEGNPSKAEDNVDPVGVEVDKESRGDDKENELLPSPKNQPAQGVSTPHASTTHHQSPIPNSKLKSRASSSSTSHNPPRRDSMSALIRRVSSKVHSPLNSPSPSSHSHSHSFSHSPLAKSSRLALSRIAPLHPNRRTPPPAPPRPPPPKKSKKMLELEEKWEMELAESVDGWACLGDEERAALRRAKRDKELGFDD